MTKHHPLTAVRLRDFRPDDLEAAYRLDQSCFEPGIAYTREQLRFFLSRPSSVGLVAETEESFAGFAIGHRSGLLGHLVTIDIAAPLRRAGVGRELLSEMLLRLAAEGAREIRLEVDLRNGSAIRFYETLGFRRARPLPGYYGRGLDGLEMVKTV